jgi:hypothetical protein
MAKRTVKSIRASFADARQDIASKQEVDDPAPHLARAGIEAGLWDGAPFDKLPPGCPIVPLGVLGKLSFFTDALGQFMSFDGMKPVDLIRLFRTTPHFVYWAWPRKKMMGTDLETGMTKYVINGVEEKKAIMCLEKECARRGLFDPSNKLRGRGAWRDDYGRLIWHSGDSLWMVENGKLQQSPPGEILGKDIEEQGIFYFRAAKIMTPWPEPVPPSESPARRIFEHLRTWTWQRPALDPVIALGSIGVMFLSGALKERPHIGVMGDFGTGKTALTNLIQGVIGDVLIRAENPTEAGVRQFMGLDALPVAIDEFEAGEDNSRVSKLVELSRLAYSGGRLLRGGADHKGVEFTARNAFFCSGINLPPMKAQDLSRFAILNTRKLEVKGGEPKAVKEWGRQILRSLMDGWKDFPHILKEWKGVLADAGLSGRGADTYGTLFAVAQLMLGAEDMEEIGLDITEPQKLGEQIAEATAEERALQGENWRDCLEHLLGAAIEAIKGGTRPTIGGVTALLELPSSAGHEEDNAREAVAMAGCGLVKEPDATLPHGQARWLLAVPPKGPLLEKMFQGKRWQQGVWFQALKAGPPEIVRSGPRGKVVKINRASERCLLIDLRAYDKLMEKDA